MKKTMSTLVPWLLLGAATGADAEDAEEDNRQPALTPGAILATELQSTHPLAVGLGQPPPVLFFGRHAEVSQAASQLGGLGVDHRRWLALEGPSGVGKGTISRYLADSLGWHYLDSGALYRMLGHAARLG